MLLHVSVVNSTKRPAGKVRCRLEAPPAPHGLSSGDRNGALGLNAWAITSRLTTTDVMRNAARVTQFAASWIVKAQSGGTKKL